MFDSNKSKEEVSASSVNLRRTAAQDSSKRHDDRGVEHVCPVGAVPWQVPLSLETGNDPES